MLNSDDIVPSVAISAMDTYRTKGTVNAALYSSIKKNIYNSIYKIMSGSDALKTRDFVNYVPAYVLASGGSKLSQQAIMDINGAILAQLHNYINYERTKLENIDQSDLLVAAAKTTDNSLPIPLTEKNRSFTASSNDEQCYPAGHSNTNYTNSIGMNNALPISATLNNENLASQNLSNFLSANNGSKSDAINTALIAAIAASVNEARKWIFRKPKAKSKEKTDLPKPTSKDKGIRR